VSALRNHTSSAAQTLRTARRRLHERFVRWALRVRPPEPTPIVLTQKRIYVLPTGAGLAYASALVVILLGAMNYNLSLGYGLVFLLGGLGVVTILHTFRNVVQLQIRPGRSEPVFAGELAGFELVLSHTRNDERPNLLLGVFMDDAEPIDIDVPAQSTATATVRLPTQRRGWVTLPRLTLTSLWPLGLVRAWSYLSPGMQVLVYPRPAAQAPALPSGDDVGHGTTRDGSGRDDFAGLRTHQLTDPPRHVAWKAVARRADGPLLTKLFSGAAAQRIWLHWDTLPPALGLEERLSIVCRWMLDAEAAGLAWGVRLPSFQLETNSGPEHLAQGLRGLALYGDTELAR
jgi:uncharacterized protein (DUF58 family)